MFIRAKKSYRIGWIYGKTPHLQLLLTFFMCTFACVDVSMFTCVWKDLYVQGCAFMCGGLKLMSTIALQFRQSDLLEPELAIS